MTKSVAVFSDRLKKRIDNYGSDKIRSVIESALETVYYNCIVLSPVETGSFRSGFYFSINTPIMDSRRETPTTPPTEGSAPTADERMISGIDRIKTKINPTVPQKFYLTNATVSGSANIPAPNAYGYYIKIEYTGWKNKPAYMPVRRARAITAITVKGVTLS